MKIDWRTGPAKEDAASAVDSQFRIIHLRRTSTTTDGKD
jgi:hypothetical protein